MTHIEEAQAFHPPPPPPAPPGLSTAWEAPKGFRIVTEVNNTFIGALYIGTDMMFLVLGGVLALMIRYQLAFPGNTFLTEEQYNQVFTMHGTTMMFLFAVPIMEATMRSTPRPFGGAGRCFRPSSASLSSCSIRSLCERRHGQSHRPR
jgi:cytochrome c oxidase subunit I+III